MKKKEHQNSATLGKDTINNWITPFLSVEKRAIKFYSKDLLKNCTYYWNLHSSNYPSYNCQCGSHSHLSHNSKFKIQNSKFTLWQTNKVCQSVRFIVYRTTTLKTYGYTSQKVSFSSRYIYHSVAIITIRRVFSIQEVIRCYRKQYRTAPFARG